MQQLQGGSDVGLIEAFDHIHIDEGKRNRAKLGLLVELDKRDVWRDTGSKDMAGWLAARYGYSPYLARRLIKTAHALQNLPLIARALEDGRLSLDRVIELCVMATPEDEASLIAWARRVPVRTIRHKAARVLRSRTNAMRRVERERFLTIDTDLDEDKAWINGVMPTTEAALVSAVLDEIAKGIASHPDDVAAGRDDSDTRRVDALVALCEHAWERRDGGDGSAADGGDGGVGGSGLRPQLIVHVDAEVLAGANRGAEIEGGGIIHGATARRLACDCRLEAWIKGRDGELQAMSVPVYLVPRALRRAVLERDHHRCTFPGCHAKAYVDVHHIVAWPLGATKYWNLVTLCRTHHKLCHEGGWRVALTRAGLTEWFRADGRPYDPMPLPPRSAPDEAAAWLRSGAEPEKPREIETSWPAEREPESTPSDGRPSADTRAGPDAPSRPRSGEKRATDSRPGPHGLAI